MRSYLPLPRLSGIPALVCAAFLIMSGSLSALDFNDVVRLRQNNVPDSVLINMIQQQGGMELTAEQQAALRAGGASESLLSAFRTVAPGPRYYSETIQPAAPAIAPTVSRVVGENEPVTPLQVTELAQMPALYNKEGWVSISNTDWQSYYLTYDTSSKRMLLSKHPNGGIEIAAGTNRAINIHKGTYKLYGDSGHELKVHVREHEVTYLSLVPFGTVGNSGLTGVARDRERSRSETLFANWAPPPAVIVQPAPVMVVPAPPPYYYYDYGYGYPYRGGSSFSFGYRW